MKGASTGNAWHAIWPRIATAKENYAGHDIFTIPVGDGKATRPLRIAQLGYDTIAASNMPTPEQIHSILDRHRAAASPFSGSSLLSARYRDVPAFSSAWAIGHIGLPFSDRGYISIFGLQLPLPEDTTFVASLRYLGTLHLRIEQIAPTDADAAHATETLTSLLMLMKSVEHTQTQMQPEPYLRRCLSRVDEFGEDRAAQRSSRADGKYPSRSGQETGNTFHRGRP